ncbi:hypothetical protein PCE1_004359 [Barthelona sp. PCE]
MSISLTNSVISERDMQLLSQEISAAERSIGHMNDNDDFGFLEEIENFQRAKNHRTAQVTPSKGAPSERKQHSRILHLPTPPSVAPKNIVTHKESLTKDVLNEIEELTSSYLKVPEFTKLNKSETDVRISHLQDLVAKLREENTQLHEICFNNYNAELQMHFMENNEEYSEKVVKCVDMARETQNQLRKLFDEQQLTEKVNVSLRKQVDELEGAYKDVENRFSVLESEHIELQSSYTTLTEDYTKSEQLVQLKTEEISLLQGKIRELEQQAEIDDGLIATLKNERRIKVPEPHDLLVANDDLDLEELISPTPKSITNSVFSADPKVETPHQGHDDGVQVDFLTPKLKFLETRVQSQKKESKQYHAQLEELRQSFISILENKS